MNPQLKKALNSIIQHAEMGVLGANGSDGCVYHNNDTFCAIGCLLTSEQLLMLVDTDSNDDVNAAGIMDEFQDIQNHLLALGITATIAEDIQTIHDGHYQGIQKSEDKHKLDSAFIHDLIEFKQNNS